MALRDDALNFLRQVFGRERAEREKAESPSAEAEKHIPTSMFSVWGREDVGGLLSVSQNLMDRYADYESMDDYPDINCLTGDTTVYVVEGSIIKPFRLHDLAAHGGGVEILAYDIDKQKLIKVSADNPRVTGNKQPVVEVGFSNGETIKCTSDHKFLTVEHGYINCSDMVVGTSVVSVWPGFDAKGMSMFLHPISGTLKVTQAATAAGEEDVYDLTTKTHNLIANGVVVHNSTHHYFTNDATQPDIDTGKTVWVHSTDEAIKDMTDTLLNRRLRIEDDIWSMVYQTVKMGNNFEEVLVTENGVVGLNSLPAPTMRRVEQSNGALIGYVQDVTGKFTQDAADLRGMLAGQTKIPDHVALFEEWQVLHARLRGPVRRSPYGFGVADGARWIWKRLVLLEDAMLIYKLTRAPARFAFYIDVTDIPSDKVDSFLRKAKQDLRKQKLVNPRTQRLDMRFNPMDNMQDFFIAVRENRELARVEVLQGPDYQATEDVDYFQRKLHGVLKVPRSYLGQDDAPPPRSILCLTGDTKVPLLDGRTLSMKELAAAYGGDEEFHVYSSAPDGSITVGRAHSPQITKRDAEIWEVTLDNGKTVRGTPDHPFMLRGGSFARLDELKAGDSLMPLYRRDSVKSRDRLEGYEMYQDPSTSKWRYAHRMVADQKWGEETLKGSGQVVHHVDFDKRNNAPKNLRAMLAEDHLQLHREHADKTINRPEVRAKAIENSKWWTGSEENKEQCRRNFEKARRPGGKQHAWCKSKEHRELKSSQMKAQWKAPESKLRARTQTDEFRAASSAMMKRNHELGKVDNRGPKNKRWRGDAAYRRLVEVVESFRCTSFKEITNWSGYSSCLIYRLVEEQGLTFKEFADKHMPYGYDPGGHKRRKALREQQKAVAASGKPGNHRVVSVRKLDVREDCYDFVVDGVHNYALDAGVFVHNSFEDVRAARVTMGVQREMKNMIRRLIMIDLASRGINPFKQDLQVMMTVPSGIYELAHNEIKNARADFATRVQPFVSMRYIQERILKLSEDEIEVIEKEREEDMKKQAEQQKMMGGEGGGPMPGGEMMPGGDLNAQHPGNMDIGPPPGVAGRPDSQAEWKRYDAARRLEEKRDRESWKRDAELQELKNQNKQLSSKMNQHESFIRELRHTYMPRNGNGKLIPQGRGRGHTRRI